jgi:hypothetical protein
MMRAFFLIVATLVMAAPAAAAASKPALLILGTPHFANPARDVANTRVGDVRTPQRQREIEAVVARLAAFRPTRVAVEWPVSGQDRLDSRYADYRAGRYVLSANEVDQIGLRLAARLGLKRIDAVDWNSAPPGPETDYDFVAYAQSHGMGAAWQAQVEAAQAAADAEGRLMSCTPVSAWLRRANTASRRRDSQRPYYEIARIGDGAASPGAAWVGAWYARNLHILDNLRGIATSPADRVVAIYGAGHGFLLDQQARESGAFEVADPLAYLPRSPRDEWTRCRG